MITTKRQMLSIAAVYMSAALINIACYAQAMEILKGAESAAQVYQATGIVGVAFLAIIAALAYSFWLTQVMVNRMSKVFTEIVVALSKINTKLDNLPARVAERNQHFRDDGK